MFRLNLSSIVYTIVFFATSVFSQQHQDISFEVLGKIKSRHANDIKSNTFSIGAETMDRDYTIYKHWKDYLGPLGFKKARIQAGWAKTEKEKGVYHFDWLDEIVFDMKKQGVEPWMCLCYGNPNYEGGGGYRLGGDIPSSKEAFEAWERWVKANVVRYKHVIDEWEVWNESHATPSDYADFLILTAKAVRDVQPKAKILAFSTSFIQIDRVTSVLDILQQKNKLHLVDQVTFHPYYLNPDTSYTKTAKLREAIWQYSDKIEIRNGENGVPSIKNQGGALRDYDWSETIQSKWALRRLLGDLGRDIETAYFAIMDMKYPFKWQGKKKDFSKGNYTLYTYGLLRSNVDQSVDYVKPSYDALQNLASIFDDKLERVENYSYETNAEESLSLFGYQQQFSHEQVVTIWLDGRMPSDDNSKIDLDFTFHQGQFSNPVYVDLRTGMVYDLPKDKWTRTGSIYRFNDIPCYDSPVLITDKSNLFIMNN
jgi:hypothetical protein